MGPAIRVMAPCARCGTALDVTGVHYVPVCPRHTGIASLPWWFAARFALSLWRFAFPRARAGSRVWGAVRKWMHDRSMRKAWEPRTTDPVRAARFLSSSAGV